MEAESARDSVTSLGQLVGGPPKDHDGSGAGLTKKTLDRDYQGAAEAAANPPRKARPRTAPIAGRFGWPYGPTSRRP